LKTVSYDGPDCKSKELEGNGPFNEVIPGWAAALDYIDMGWFVLPLHSITESGVCTCKAGQACTKPGKHPLYHPKDLRNGANSATRDRGLIETWFDNRWPWANVGVALWPSELMAMDVDPRHGGDESYDRLVDAYGPFSPTLRALTGGGGWHDYYMRPDGISAGGNLPGYPGIEIKVRTYVVAPPSLHETGKRYRFDGPPNRWRNPIPYPESLQQIPISQPKGKKGPLDMSSVKVNTRNITFFGFGRHLSDRGISDQSVRLILGALNHTYAEQPLPEKEMSKIIGQVLQPQYRRPSWTPGPSPTAWALYEWLMNYREGMCVDVSTDDLANYLKVSRRTVYNAINSAKKWGIISVARRPGGWSCYTPLPDRAQELRSGILEAELGIFMEPSPGGEGGEDLTLFSSSKRF